MPFWPMTAPRPDEFYWMPAKRARQPLMFDWLATTTVIANHFPGQLGDLACTQAGFDREQYDKGVSLRVPAGRGVGEEVFQIGVG